MTISRELDWEFIKSCLKHRREARQMRKLGYEMIEADWKIIRGGQQDHIIQDVKISADKKHLWVKMGPA